MRVYPQDHSVPLISSSLYERFCMTLRPATGSVRCAVLISIFLLSSCKSSPAPAAEASNSSAAPAAAPAAAAKAVQSSPLPSTFVTGTLTDPAMNGMVAQTLTIPTGWKLQGIVVTTPCTQLPWPVYRAYSPDGLTEMRMNPAAGWKWAQNPAVPIPKECLPLSGPETAAQFLSNFVETIQGGVHVVGPMPVSDAYRKNANDFAAKLNAQGQQFAAGIRARYTSDVAALRIETKNGSFVIEQRLQTAVQCDIQDSGMFAGGNCFARVDVLRAPQGKLDALAQLVDANNLPNPKMTPQWQTAETQLIQQRGQAAIAAVQRIADAGMKAQKAMFDSFMATSQQNHQAFEAQQESQFQSSMNNAQASMNAQSTAASDMVDYALDQQTVTGSGGTVKVSSAYSQTWSNGQGQWYQTVNPSSNPNGSMPGNWTQDTKVHGNGQPM
jgi:hypothetical protein